MSEVVKTHVINHSVGLGSATKEEVHRMTVNILGASDILQLELTDDSTIIHNLEGYKVLDDYNIAKVGKWGFVGALLAIHDEYVDEVLSEGVSLVDIMTESYSIIEKLSSDTDPNSLYVNLDGVLYYKDLIIRASELLDQSPYKVVCHGDPMWSNILVKGKTFIITNYSYTSVRDHAWDFAALVSMDNIGISGYDYSPCLDNHIIDHILLLNDRSDNVDELLRLKITVCLYMYDIWKLATEPHKYPNKIKRVKYFTKHSMYAVETLVRKMESEYEIN